MRVPFIITAGALPLSSSASLLKLAEGDSPLHDVKPKYDFPFIKTLLVWLANIQGTALIVLAILFVLAAALAMVGKFTVHSAVMRNIGIGLLVAIVILAALVANAPRIIEWAGYQDVLGATTSMGSMLVPGLL